VNARIARRVLLVVTGLWFVAWPARPQKDPSYTPFKGLPIESNLNNGATERKVDDLLKQMTLEEKVGQLVQYSAGTRTGPGTGRSDYDEMVERGQVGSLFNLENAKAANHFQHIAVDRSRLHIPLLYGLDVIHGYRTEFPVPLGLASTWDPDIVEKAARIAAHEAASDGVRWVFSPMVDIARDARWGRMIEGAGEDPFLDSAIARAYVRGYQGKKLSDWDSVVSCPKHYVGYGAAEAGRDYNTTEISEHTLREVYLPPFYAALNAGAGTIMSSFNSLNGIPASANPFSLRQVLRKEWQFPGMVVSDWTSLGELIPHGIANDGKMATFRAFTAGVDMDMESNIYHEHLVDLVKSGKISEAQVDESVRRVLRVKFALGLFESPYTDEKAANDGPLTKEGLDVARAAAERSFVLLKNEVSGSRRTLPLSSDLKSYALVGPLADDAGEMLGSWGGHGQAKDVVTLRSAMVERFGAGKVKYATGGEIEKATDAQIAEAVAIARGADVVILALGENAPEMTGEAASRAHLDLPGRQEALLEQVVATGKPVVLILFSGRPLTLPWAFEHVPAVLEAWFPGVQAGPAMVRTLFGESVPSGRLVVTWPRWIGQIPLYYNALSTGRPAGDADLSRPPSEGTEKFVSRYVDETNTPQFPFGYGLSYTEFRYSKPEVNAQALSAKSLSALLRSRAEDSKEVLSVSANVTNSGKVAAEEVVQLYVRLRGTSVAEPMRALKGFQRVILKAGETKKVTFPLTAEALAVWDANNEHNVEPSKVNVWVSPDSARGEAIELEITE